MNIFLDIQDCKVECPSCGEELGGFFIDPRGAAPIECEYCDHVFSVPKDSALTIRGANQ